MSAKARQHLLAEKVDPGPQVSDILRQEDEPEVIDADLLVGSDSLADLIRRSHEIVPGKVINQR